MSKSPLLRLTNLCNEPKPLRSTEGRGFLASLLHYATVIPAVVPESFAKIQAFVLKHGMEEARHYFPSIMEYFEETVLPRCEEYITAQAARQGASPRR